MLETFVPRPSGDFAGVGQETYQHRADRRDDRSAAPHGSLLQNLILLDFTDALALLLAHLNAGDALTAF